MSDIMDNKTMIIIAVVAVVAVAGVAAFVVMNNGGNGGDSEGALVDKILKESECPSKSSRLWVYGNANEDDKLNDDDLTYLQGIIDGKNKTTVLADANADGKVNSDDIDFLKKLINAD